MKKIISILLVIASLFTLNSNFLCCGSPIVSEPTSSESLNDNNSISFKEKKIKKFFSEKGNYFPTDKLMEINSLLHTLRDDELELVLSVNFKNPSYITLAAVLGGAYGIDDLVIHSKIKGSLRLILGVYTSSMIALCEKLKNLSKYMIINDKEIDKNVKKELEESFIIVDKYDKQAFKSLLVLVPATIVSWIINIFTASDRAKEYNYQLLLKTLGKQS